VSKDTIGFIGGGNMAQAIAGGLVAGGFDPASIRIADPHAGQRDRLQRDLPGVHVTPDNAVVAAQAACIVLAVKPQVLAAVCRELRAVVQENRPLVISIAAGVRSADIDTWLGGGLAIVRVMPNQPALLRRGIAGLYANERTASSDIDRASDIMGAVGEVVRVPREADIDAVTAISGSGPAYFFLLIDMLEKTAAELGIEPAAAARLALATARGSAELAAAGGESMDELIARVRSPGGTTAAALDSLEAAGVRAIFRAALEAARDRAIELADRAHTDSTP
jgi:pyrroline-5-carboxylate reductase